VSRPITRNTRSTLLLAMAVVLWIVGSVMSTGPLALKAAGRQSPSPHRAVLDTYCVTCHNARLRTAALQLDTADVDHPEANPAIWEKVARKLRARDMPPPGLPRPDHATYESLANYLEAALDDAAATTPNPGRPAAYRLSQSSRVVRKTTSDLLLKLGARPLSESGVQILDLFYKQP
jgi:hypothetical protein